MEALTELNLANLAGLQFFKCRLQSFQLQTSRIRVIVTRPLAATREGVGGVEGGQKGKWCKVCVWSGADHPLT